ncbi:peptidase [Aquimarina celericrescens]|nr:peptidase [Aquimarina celericrescens]
MSVFFVACEQEEETMVTPEVSDEVLVALEDAGFNVIDQPPIKFEESYIVEGDILLTHKQILNLAQTDGLSVNSKQYSTNNLVSTNGSRNITVFVSSSFNAATSAGIDLAIQRYNAENLEITFQRVNSSSNADITISRLNFILEFFGVLGSAGFPTAGGDPFNEISLSGRLSNLGFDTGGIATIVSHEMGHCIGFRHTDYFDRSISCGGAADNEGDAGVGANLIPGTPAGANLSDASWMLACSDGSDRPFNTDDQTALNFLY